MIFHNFWRIIGSTRAKSLGGAYVPPPPHYKLNLRLHGTGLTLKTFLGFTAEFWVKIYKYSYKIRQNEKFKNQQT